MDNQRDIAADKAVCEAATAGPWNRGSLESYSGRTGIAFRNVYRKPDRKAIDAMIEHGPPWDVEPAKSLAWEAEQQGHIRVNGANCDNDAQFIATAREALPWYIAELEKVRAELEKVREWARRDVTYSSDAGLQVAYEQGQEEVLSILESDP